MTVGNRQPAATQHERSCPMCGAQVGADSLVCARCGEDLTRSGVVLSPGVRPVSPRRRRRGRPRALALVLTLLVLATALVGFGISSAPLGTWVPALRPVQVIVTASVQRALRWIEMVNPKERTP